MTYSRLFLLILTIFSGGFAASQQKLTAPQFFDFGIKRSDSPSGRIAVDELLHYRPELGYGWLVPPSETYTTTVLPQQNPVTGDGVRSPQSLVFQIDLAPGGYWIEILLDGGQLSRWRGTINLNKKVVVTELLPYRYSNEGELPPAYWVILRQFSISDSGLVFSITADGQATALAGLTIYPDDSGSLQLRKGQLVASTPLQAPNATLILKLLNSGYVGEAQRLIDAIPEESYRMEKALLLQALAGRLEIENPRALLEWALRLLRDEAKVRPSTLSFPIYILENYLLADSQYKIAGWEWARRYTGGSIFVHQDLAGRVWNELIGIEEHPLHHRLIWELGKLSFMAWVEEHPAYLLSRAQACFAQIQPYYPDHKLLQVYSGNAPHTDPSETTVFKQIPTWPQKTHEAIRSMINVIHYWVKARQADNGEFGGKYDDDVEMLRWWPVARLALDDSLTLLGMRRLVDGIWNSEWIYNGFSRKLRDVEHSSEPVADTQPMMIGLDYGNPIYVERCMQSIKGIRDLWTGINGRGHRHFKSAWYSATELDIRPPRDCDVPMNTRTVKALLWLAWYNRHPFAMQFLREWSNAWLEDCYRTDKGKPYGVVPAAIRYEDDAIGGHADNWHHPGLFWHYFDFSGGQDVLLQFLAAYDLTRDPKYLRPIECALEIVAKHPDANVDSSIVGSEAWVAATLLHSRQFQGISERWRLLSKNTKYDSLLLHQTGSDYVKFRISGDMEYLADGSDKVVKGILTDRELITTEGYFTDRIEIGDVHSGGTLIDATHLESVYTGGPLFETFYPFYDISWRGMGKDFVALVVRADEKNVEIQACNAGHEPQRGQLVFWRLEPGQYEWTQNPDDKPNLTAPQRIDVRYRTFYQDILLPAGACHRITIHQIAPYQMNNDGLADLAITREEVQIIDKADRADITITIPVHNIGIKAAKNFVIALRQVINGRPVTLQKKKIRLLPAPLDLEPQVVHVEFTLSRVQYQTGLFQLSLDPDNQLDEITELNNQFIFSL